MAAAACSAGFGGSLELNGGALRLSSDQGPRAETAVTFGASLNVEFDWLRDADLGGGLGWQSVRTGAGSGDPGASVSAWPMHIWYAAAIGNSAGWKTRPRVTMGWSLANGEGDTYADAYLGLGASIHLAPGRALHLMAGPEVVRATDDRSGGPNPTYQGWGATVRLRLFRMAQPTCDPATRAEAVERSTTKDEWSCQ
jgi:hypothetical protein